MLMRWGMKPILSSKWNYIVCGINFMVAVVGAIFHNSFLLTVGIIFTIFNYYVADFNRRLEDEEIRKSITQAKE